MFGRPGTRVVPEGWGRDLAPVAVNTMVVPVSVRHPGSTKVWDEPTQQNVVTPLAAFWAGFASVEALSGVTVTNDQVTAGGDVVHLTGYRVGFPWPVDDVEAGDIVTVGAGYTGDPTLAGRSLRVDDVVRGEWRVERDAFCTLTDDI
jgi:hypothetical protein